MNTLSYPKISVVTPSFNQARFIESTIRSVLGQNYQNLEYVIIDGGSNDGSVDIIERYADRLQWWISEKDRGHAHALNKGFERTSGEIMCWLNSDDMYLPWTFEVVAEVFSAFPEVNWIVGFNAFWNDRGALTEAFRMPKNIYDYLLARYMWIQQESVFWRRSLWEQAGGKINEQFRVQIDGELWSRFFLFDSLYVVDCILAGYRRHAENRTAKHQKTTHEEIDLAITQMRKNCSSEVLSTARTLNYLNKLKCSRVGKHLPISRVARLLFPRHFDRASYPTLTYSAGSWHKSHQDFFV